MAGPEIKQVIDKVIDEDGITKEDADLVKDLNNASENQQGYIADFFKEQGSKVFYKNAAPKINTSLEKFINEGRGNEEQVKDITTFINSLKAGDEETEVANTSLGSKINTIADGSGKNNINTLLSQEKTSFGEVFEQSSEAIRNNLLTIITAELLKDPYLAQDGKGALGIDGKLTTSDGKRELTQTGEEVKQILEKEVTKNRSDNITFGLLDAIVNKVESGWTALSGNKEKILEQKTSLLLTLQKLMKSGGLTALGSGNTGLLKNADISRSTIQDFQNNFKTFLKEKIKEAGLDITDKNTKKKSLIAGSKYSTMGLLLSGTKRNETIKQVVGKGFKEGLSYFNNFENTQKVMQSLVSIDGSKLDMTNLPQSSTEETMPSEDDMKLLVNHMNELIKDMPTDPNGLGAQQLKEKMIYNKMDKILDNFGPMKDIAIAIAQWLNNFKGGKGILAFLVKSFGLKEGDIQKLLDRPYIKVGIDEYKKNILEGQKDSKWLDKHLHLGDKDLNWDVKTSYFRLANNLVYREDDKKNRIMSRVNDKGEIKDLDLTLAADKALDAAYCPAREGHIEDFIMNDLNTTEMVTGLKNTLETKFAKDKGKQNILVDVQKKYFTMSPDAKTLTPNDEKIKGVIKSILEKNPYVYSTEDIIGAFLENGVTEVNAAPEAIKPDETKVDNTSSNTVINMKDNSAEKKTTPVAPEKDRKKKASNKKINIKDGEV